jgi:hypothetical protein
MRDDLTAERVRTARAFAAAADLLQVALLPAFFPEAIPPINNVIDVVVAIVLVRLLGWHWAFLPAFAVEAIPFLDLAPTWTAAVFLATRGIPAERADVVVEPPAPPRDLKALPSPPQPPRDASGA